MYDNLMTVEATVKCIECHRTCSVQLRLGRGPGGTLTLPDAEPGLPDGWQVRTSRLAGPRRYALCAVCCEEAP